MNKFQDVFSNDLPGIPPECESDFGVDIDPNTQPISIPPYIMAQAKLKELKLQLKDLLDKGLIQPSIFLWGAIVFFVKKKYGTLRMYIDYRQLKKSHYKEQIPFSHKWWSIWSAPRFKFLF